MFANWFASSITGWGVRSVSRGEFNFCCSVKRRNMSLMCAPRRPITYLRMSWSQLLSCSVVEDEAPIFRVGLESGAGERARGLLCGWVLVTTMKQQATVLFPVKPYPGTPGTRELLGTLVKCMGTHIKQPNNIL